MINIITRLRNPAFAARAPDRVTLTDGDMNTTMTLPRRRQGVERGFNMHRVLARVDHDAELRSLLCTRQARGRVNAASGALEG